MRYSKYTLPNGRKIYLTQRPDVVTDQKEVYDFIQKENIKIRFQYTDNWVDFPEAVPSKWFLWIPGRSPTIESVYSSTVTLMKYNDNNPIDFSIWMHCDSSSMRAPTYFGLFLHVAYPFLVDQISETLEVSDNYDYQYARYSLPNRYADVSLKQDKEVGILIELWKKGDKEAYNFLMNCKSFPTGE